MNLMKKKHKDFNVFNVFSRLETSSFSKTSEL